MRYVLIIAILFSSPLASAAETYPLWDGHDSVADYAKRVNLQPTKTLDLGNGVKMELVLVPAGKFIMGTPEPTPVDEEGFSRKIRIAKVLLTTTALMLFVIFAIIIAQAIRKRRRPQLSLRQLTLMTIIAGGCVLSGAHWRQSLSGLEKARSDYPRAKLRSDEAESREKPAHPVTLTRPFYVGKFVVTQEQWQQVMTNPNYVKDNHDNPATGVSWNDAQNFCRNLSRKANQLVRLPTEAEWEFSCRGGTITSYYSGDTNESLDRVAWHSGNSQNVTCPVGQKESNAFGLYDMHGNVWQWCNDYYDRNYYAKSPYEDPQGPPEGGYRVLRGGSALLIYKDCRSARRRSEDPTYRNEFIGFRVVVSESKSP